MPQQHDPEDKELLTKMECWHLFCKKLKNGDGSYDKYCRDYIKFKYLARGRDKGGKVADRLPRIPRSIAEGLINCLKGECDPSTDPPMTKLNEFSVRCRSDN